MDYSVIIASIISALATLISVWMSRKLIHKTKDPVVEDAVKSTNVYTALDYTMNEMKADRAYVLEFHNGSHYYSGRGQKKFSCTHEIVEEGISHQCNHSQEHRVSNYHGYISELIEKESFIYSDCNQITDKNFLTLLQKSGTCSIINVPIKTLNGKIIGILGVDYVRATKITQKKEDFYLKFMKQQSRIIAGYLS
tara:strand:+ start:3903 stop:4487 length:585 start_codon:yes stop_codon:yes gene_type:complete